MTGNISKKRREELIEKIGEIRAFLAAAQERLFEEHKIQINAMPEYYYRNLDA